MVEQPFFFDGGMDTDSDPRAIQQGDYVLMRNGRLVRMRDRHDGVIRALPAPREVIGPTLEGEGVCIGRYDQVLMNRSFFFIRSKSSELSDTIIVYDGQDDRSYRVITAAQVREQTLQFHRELPLGGAEIIDGVLYWAGCKEVLSINVEAAIITSFPSYATVHPDRDQGWTYRWFGTGQLHTGLRDITLIKPNPSLQLLVKLVRSQDYPEYVDSSSFAVNNKSYQFAYRYYYRDGERSVMSPISRTIYAGELDDEFDLIEVSVPAPNSPYLFPRLVERVEFFVREGNTGTWRSFREITRKDDLALFNAQDVTTASDPQIVLIFDGTYNYVPDQGDLARLFDLVPVASKALSQGGEYLLLANNDYGFETPSNIDMDFLVRTEPIVEEDQLLEGYYVFTQTSNAEGGLDYNPYVKVPTGPGAGFYQISNFRVPIGGNNFVARYFPPYSSFPYTFGAAPAASDPDTIVGVSLAFNFFPLSEPFLNNPTFTTEYPDIPVNLIFTDNFTPDIDTRTSDAMSLKSNSRYSLGICFFDFAGRTPGVIRVGDVNTPAYNFLIEDPRFARRLYVSFPQAQSLDIPIWAHSYSICLTKNLTTRSFLQIKRYQFKGFWNQLTQSYEATQSANSEYAGYAIPGYTYSEGDLFRSLLYTGEQSLHKVLGQSDGITHVSLNAPIVGGRFTGLIEVFTPHQVTEDEPYYEYLNFLVQNPGTPTRAYSSTSFSVRGDIFTERSRINDNTGDPPYVLEHMSPVDRNDNTLPWDTDAGRPIGLCRQFKQVNYPTAISYSEPFKQGFEVRGLNTFNLADIEYADISVGPIRRLIEARRGSSETSVVLAIGEEDAASVYVGKSILNTPDGQEALTSSGKVIGAINLLLGGYGTRNPESVVRSDSGRVYWFDETSGTFVRYTSEGIRPISDNGIAAFSRSLSLLAQDKEEHMFLHAGYDPSTKEVLFSTPASPHLPVPYSPPATEDQWEVATEVSQVATPSTTTLVYEGLRRGVTYRVVYVKSQNVGYVTDVIVSQDNGGQYIIGESFVSNGNVISIIFPNPLRPTPVRIERLVQDSSFLISSDPQLIAVNDESGRWSWVGDVAPEGIGRTGNKVVFWLNRRPQPWDDHSNTIGNIYLTVAAGDERLRRCDFEAVSSDSTVVPSKVIVRILQPHPQVTDMVTNDLTFEEGIWRSPILRDLNTPGIISQDLSRITGDTMRGAYAYVTFVYNNNETDEIRNVTVRYNPSTGH